MKQRYEAIDPDIQRTIAAEWYPGVRGFGAASLAQQLNLPLGTVKNVLKRATLHADPVTARGHRVLGSRIRCTPAPTQAIPYQYIICLHSLRCSSSDSFHLFRICILLTHLPIHHTRLRRENVQRVLVRPTWTSAKDGFALP